MLLRRFDSTFLKRSLPNTVAMVGNIMAPHKTRVNLISLVCLASTGGGGSRIAGTGCLSLKSRFMKRRSDFISNYFSIQN